MRLPGNGSYPRLGDGTINEVVNGLVALTPPERRPPLAVLPLGTANVLAADLGLYGDSRFFPARGNFWFGRTCNTWTAQRLRDGGVDIRTFMTLRAKSVMAQIRDHGQAGACVE